MNYLLRSIASIAVFAITSLAHGALITSNLEDATNGGGFFGVVTFQDNGANTVKITADIRDPINVGLTQGDILGLWFDVDGFGGLTPPININPWLPLAIGEDSIGTKPFADNNVNINGSGEDNWDLAVQVGENGAAGGFNQMVMFDLTIMGLEASLFDGQRVGMRVQSIAGGSFGGGSSKLLRVPEPGILALFGLGLLGLGLARRKRLV